MRHETARAGHRQRRFCAIAALGFALACGGKTDGIDEGTGGGDDGPAVAQGGSTSGTSNPGASPGNTELGMCKLGFLLVDEPSRDCAWLARERCYDTKLAACACVCPSNRQDSICSSGFYDGPNGKTEVKCY
jgi:hypothetical protein